MKKTPLKKKSKNKIPTLKRKLWDATREFIYARDMKNGTWKCFTCDKECSGSGRQAGHFIPDSVCPPELRYDERNIHVQCYHCNINLGGWGERYAARMEKKYGKPLVEILRKMQKKLQGQKWDASDYEQKTLYYKEKTEAIE